MQLARVVGDVVATHKDENLSGLKLLVLQPLGADGSASGRTLVAVDVVGAGSEKPCFSCVERKRACRFTRDGFRPTPEW